MGMIGVWNRPRNEDVLIVRVHNKPLSVAAVCINNPERSPFGIHG
jgi:hypothetical protein